MFPRESHPAVLSALLALTLYSVTLGGTYVYDDRYIILTDPRIADVRQWTQFWTKDYFNGAADNLYRPLVSMSYALQAKLHGTGENHAWAFHLVNWLLHAGASAAVAELARRMTRSRAAALVAGLLFAAHPIHVEAVANIVGRAELMCGVGTFAALVLFFRPLTTARAVALWGCAVFALLSKEQGLLLPLLLLAAIPLRRRDQTIADNRPAVLWLVILLAWTLAGYIIFRERILKFWWDRSFLDATINPIIQSAGRDRVLMPLVLLGRYVALLIAPLRLLPDYGGEVIGSRVRLNDPYLYLGAATGIAGAVACVFASIRNRWTILFCLLCFALLYGLISNALTLIGTNFAERLMYIPSAFACILAAMFFCRLNRKITLSLVTVILVLFSIRTVTYAARWNDPAALFERGIEQQPQSIRLYLLLSEEWQRRADLPKARQIMSRAREVTPTYYRVWLDSARLELSADEFDAAERFAVRGQHITPTAPGQRLIQTIQEARAAKEGEHH